MQKIKLYIKHNPYLLVGLITCLALVDNLTLLAIKLLLEAIFMGGLWIIILAVDYIKDKKKVEEKPYIKNGIDTRRIIEQLDEVYGAKK